MFGCNNLNNLSWLTGPCSGQASTMKKIGDYLYHYDFILGKGSYSNVYEGVNYLTEERVAIKVINLQHIKQTPLVNLLYQQIGILKQLQHPSIIKIHRFIKSDNNQYIIMEMCQSKNLSQLIKECRSGGRNSSLPKHKLQKILYNIFEGLNYLSSKNIIHRDLKTANILLDQNGNAKLTDFGFATRAFGSFNDSFFVGTPLYTPPEVFFEQKYGPKTDIWSFGVIVYEMIFGTTPLQECSNEQEFLKKLVEPLDLPSKGNKIIDEDDDLLQMLEGCLEQNYYNRWSIQALTECAFIKKLGYKYRRQPETSAPSSPRSATNHQTMKMSNAFSHLSRLIHENVNSRKISTPNKSRQSKHGSKTKAIAIEPYYINSNSISRIAKEKVRLNTNNSQSGSGFSPKGSQTIYSKVGTPKLPPKCQPKSATNFSKIRSNIIEGQYSDCSSFEVKTETSSFNQHYINNEGYRNNLGRCEKNRKIYNFFQPAQPISKAVYQTRPIATFEPMPAHRPKLFVLNLKYYEIVALMHYCRLVYRVLSIPGLQSRELVSWLIMLSNQLKNKVNQPEQIDYFKKTIKNITNEHIQSLKSVILKYHQRHSELRQTTTAFPTIQTISQIIDILLTRQFPPHQKQLLVCLCRETSLLKQCIQKQNFSQFEKQSKAEQVLKDHWQSKHRIN